jgi:hypothetical protein
MTHYTLVRDETIPEPRARGLAYAVVVDDGSDEPEPIGTISAGPAGWRVFSAGPGVPVDQNTVHATRDAAVAALVGHRAQAREPGGALHVNHTGLTGFQRDVLDFAALHFRSPVAREVEIRSRFDMSGMRFASHVLALLDNGLALQYAPQVVNRERRLREERKARRTRQAAIA